MDHGLSSIFPTNYSHKGGSMRKFISIVLTLALFTSISAPALASSTSLHPIEIVKETYVSSTEDGVFSESYNYVDSLGDLYNVSFTKSSTQTTTVITDEFGSLVSKSEYIDGNDFITNTIPITTRAGSDVGTFSENINIDYYVEDDSEFNETFSVQAPLVTANSVATTASSSGGDPIPGSTSFKHYKTYNTDYIYLGNILKGDGYYRRLAGYDEYNRSSYTFQKGAALASIFTILGGIYSFLTGTTQIAALAGGMGISIIGSALGMDWNLDACVRSFDFQIQCRMEYNNSTKIMSQITRKLEYLYGYDEFIEADSYVFDSFSYGSPNQAVNAYCSEAVGYGAAAFSAKYITGNYPNLVLPVSGPSYEWNY